jgi:hypothetical protein
MLADDKSFDPETLALLREAFDLAWAKIPPAQQNAVLRNTLAELIKQIARQGETEPYKLSARALAAFHGLT